MTIIHVTECTCVWKWLFLIENGFSVLCFITFIMIMLRGPEIERRPYDIRHKTNEEKHPE